MKEIKTPTEARRETRNERIIRDYEDLKKKWPDVSKSRLYDKLARKYKLSRVWIWRVIENR